MLIYDEPLSSGQPPLSGHLSVPPEWLLNGGSTIIILLKDWNKVVVFLEWYMVAKVMINMTGAPNENIVQNLLNIALF